MALTVSTPYARCEFVSQVDTTTIEVTTITGEPLGPNWIGRAFYMITSGSADGQWREITAVDVGNSRFTMAYPWRTTSDDPLIAATGGAQDPTDSPAYEVEPSTGDIIYVSYMWDDLADGVNIIQTNTQIELVSRITVSGAFIWSTDRNVLSRSPTGASQYTYLQLQSAGRYVQGNLSKGGYGFSGGTLRFYTIGATALVSWNNNNDLTQVQLFGVEISVNGDQAVFARIYGDTRDMCRLVDCTQTGDMGGRWSGAKSFIVRHKAFGSTTSVGMIGSATPFGGVFGCIAQDAIQGFYHNGSIGGSARIDGAVASNLISHLILVTQSSTATNMELSNLVFDETVPYVAWSASSGNPLKLTNNITVQVKLDGVLQGGGRLHLKRNDGLEVFNDTTSDGLFTTIPRLLDALFASGQTLYSQATKYGPYDYHYARYGARAQIGSHTTSKNPYANVLLPEILDPFIVLSEGDVAALTGISTTFSTQLITVSQSHPIEEIYQRQKYDAAQSANIQYLDQDDITSIASQVDLGHWDLTLTGGTLSSPSDRSVTTTGIIDINSPAILQAPVMLTSGTLRTSDDNLVAVVATISGTAIFEMEDISDTSLPNHVFGAGGKLLISGATSDTTVDLRGATFNATSVVENTSGENITVRLSPLTTVPILTETSGTITIDNSFVSTINLPNIIDDSKYYFFIDGVAWSEGLKTVSGGTGISEVFTEGADFTAGDDWEVWIVYYDSVAGAKTELDISGSFGSSTETISRTESQVDCPVYTENGLDGADYTSDYTIDNADNEVDIDLPANFNNLELFAFLKYAQTVSEANILDLFGAFGADDAGNYWFDHTRIELYFDNTTSTDAVEESGTRWYIRNGAELDPVKRPRTGTGAVDVNWREKVYVAVVNTTGTPVITGDIADLNDISTADIRTELSTELARIDVAVSTRNATAPDNAGITANGVAIAALNDFDPDNDTVAHVTLVDTTTTNSDMRGTDGANTTAPLDSTATQVAAAAALTAYDPPTKAELDAAQTAIQADVATIPTNPLLTDDARLDNLDAPVSAAGDATAANQASIAAALAVVSERTDNLPDDPASEATVDAVQTTVDGHTANINLIPGAL